MQRKVLYLRRTPTAGNKCGARRWKYLTMVSRAIAAAILWGGAGTKQVHLSPDSNPQNLGIVLVPIDV